MKKIFALIVTAVIMLMCVIPASALTWFDTPGETVVVGGDDNTLVTIDPEDLGPDDIYSSDTVYDTAGAKVEFWIFVGFFGAVLPIFFIAFGLYKMSKHPEKRNRWFGVVISATVWIVTVSAITVLLLLGA